MIINGNSLRIPLADGSVQCCVTSPPYFGLRDYGVDGQLGLEQTPDEYVANMVQVFREVWRVLKDDGVLFLNLGDSYYGSNQTGGTKSKEGSSKRAGRMFSRRVNVQRESSYGRDGKALADYQENGCLCGNLCDVCRVVYQTHKFRNDGLLVAMLVASLSATSHVHKESLSGHLPTSDSLSREARTLTANLDFLHSQDHEYERLRVALVSMLGESSLQLLDECLLRANHGECLLCARSLADCVLGCADTTVCTCGTAGGVSQSTARRLDTSCNLAHQYSTITHLKPKDLIGIPWRVAFALQADGWYLRSDVIWSKPNPMPESVTDRPTRAHEYIFLMSKAERYYYDHEAIKEESTEKNWQSRLERASIKSSPTASVNGIRQRPDKQRGHSRRHDGFNERWDLMTKAEQAENGRNKRSVWTVATHPYEGAHFATFPPKLIEPCILAGSRVGDIVLDCFNGSGTTGEVAMEHNRRYVGIELNPAYIQLTQERLDYVQPRLMLEAA